MVKAIICVAEEIAPTNVRTATRRHMQPCNPHTNVSVQILFRALASLLSQRRLPGSKRRIHIKEVSVLSEIRAVIDLAYRFVVDHFRTHMVVAKVSSAEKAIANLAGAYQRSVPFWIAFSHSLTDKTRQL